MPHERAGEQVTGDPQGSRRTPVAGGSSGGAPPSPGQVVEQRKLRTRAVYRVLRVDGDHVDVEVIEAPGLAPGERYRFARASVEEMTVVSER
jgi:hypothetical protein